MRDQSTKATRQREVDEHLQALKDDPTPSYALAALNDLLSRPGADELRQAFAEAPPASLSAELANYWAAMVEHVCAQRLIAPPAWTHSIAPLETPMFGSSLASLRLHLLAHSPPAFRRRNIFVGTTIGGRV